MDNSENSKNTCGMWVIILLKALLKAEPFRIHSQSETGNEMKNFRVI